MKKTNTKFRQRKILMTQTNSPLKEKKKPEKKGLECHDLHIKLCSENFFYN